MLGACHNKKDKQDKIAIDYESWDYVLNWQETAHRSGTSQWMSLSDGQLLTFFFNSKHKKNVLPREGAYHYASSVFHRLSSQAYFATTDSTVLFCTYSTFGKPDTLGYYSYQLYSDTVLVLTDRNKTPAAGIRFRAMDKE